jgi:hypothetical protein
MVEVKNTLKALFSFVSIAFADVISDNEGSFPLIAKPLAVCN